MARITALPPKVLLLPNADQIAAGRLSYELALFAKQSLSDAIHSGEGSPQYDKYVNSRLGADEFTVVPPGPIVYVFHWWNEIVTFALETLRARSPVRSGLYRDSWFPMVNGVVISDYSAIPINAEVIITNNQPYARKIEVGFMHMSVEPGVAGDARTIVRGRFGNLFDVKQTMVTLPGGYILKGHFRKGIRKYSRTKLRRDTREGAQMTYPALVMNVRE